MTRAQTQESYHSRPHILVVDDDARICDLVCRYLLDHDFIAVSAGDAAQARAMIAQMDFDAAIVDVMMPGETGLSLAGDIGLPVIMLTALGEVDDRLAGFEAGADDYLPKPFEPAELVMRLKALLRRTMVAQLSPSDKPVSIGAYSYDIDGGLLRDTAGQMIALTEAEHALLRIMASRPGHIFSRDDLAKACDISGDRAVDVQVTRLRRKIEEDSRNPRYLMTARGKGYYLRIGGGS